MSGNENVERYCKFCEFALSLTDGDQMLCSRHGVVPASYSCHRFRYDPLKRVPERNKEKPHLDYVKVD